MNKKTAVCFIVFLLLVSFSCKRDIIEEPQLSGPAGFYITLKGSADPSVLYLEKSSSLRPRTTLSVQVLNNDGSPVVGRPVYFEQWSSGKVIKVTLGYFDTPSQYVGTRYTNSFGMAQIVFNAPSSQHVSENTTMYIRAILGAGRNDYRKDEGYLDSIQDWIPIQLIHHTY